MTEQGAARVPASEGGAARKRAAGAVSDPARRRAAPALRSVGVWYWLAAATFFVGAEFAVRVADPRGAAQDAWPGVMAALNYASGYTAAFLVGPPLASRISRAFAPKWTLFFLFLAINAVFTLQDASVCVLIPTNCSLSPAWFRGRMLNEPFMLLMAVSLLGYSAGLASVADAEAVEVRASQARAEMARARLNALNAQLQPHFLFNALQSVVTLMHRDAAGASLMLDRMADLLRETSEDRPDVVSVSEEIATVHLYTGIESVRFGDRLQVEVEVEPGTEQLPVPHLVLQPIVENSIRHAVDRRGRGRVSIRAWAPPSGAAVVLEVEDDGARNSAPRAQRRASVGLANVRRRLEVLYGDAASLTVAETDSGGTLVTLTIPRVEHVRAPNRLEDDLYPRSDR